MLTYQNQLQGVDVEHGWILFSIDMICHESFIVFLVTPGFKK